MYYRDIVSKSLHHNDHTYILCVQQYIIPAYMYIVYTYYRHYCRESQLQPLINQCMLVLYLHNYRIIYISVLNIYRHSCVYPIPGAYVLVCSFCQLLLSYLKEVSISIITVMDLPSSPFSDFDFIYAQYHTATAYLCLLTHSRPIRAIMAM